MKRINEKLATHDLGVDTNHSPDKETKLDTSNGPWAVLDVRDMNDGFNELVVYEAKINKAIEAINKFGRVVICCTAGISRSNAIALGVLIQYFGMDYNSAFRLLKEKVPFANPEPSHLRTLKKLFSIEDSYFSIEDQCQV